MLSTDPTSIDNSLQKHAAPHELLLSFQRGTANLRILNLLSEKELSNVVSEVTKILKFPLTKLRSFKNLIGSEFIMMSCAIWYHSYDLKNVKTPMESVFLVLQAKSLQLKEHVSLKASSKPKSNTSPWFFSRFLNCTSGTQIAQNITYMTDNNSINHIIILLNNILLNNDL